MVKHITLENVERYYDNLNGNLYYNDKGDWLVLAGGYTLSEVKQAIENGVEFIYASGPAKIVSELKDVK